MFQYSKEIGRVFLDERPLVAFFMSNRSGLSACDPLPLNDRFMTNQTENAPFLLYPQNESMVDHIVVCRHISH